jgi:hypothetical protein
MRPGHKGLVLHFAKSLSGLGNSYGMKYIRSSHHPSKDIGSLTSHHSANMNVTFPSTAGSISNPQDKDSVTASQLSLPKQGFAANLIPRELYKYPHSPTNCFHLGSASLGTLYRDQFQSISRNSVAPASLVAAPTTAPNPTLRLTPADRSESSHIHTKDIHNLAAPPNMNIDTTTA